MAQPYVTGPVAVYVGIGSLGNPLATYAPVFFGHGERAPKPSLNRGYEPVMCDLSGTQLPFDVLYEGQDALIRVDFTRWNEPVYQAISNITSTAVPTNLSPGVDPSSAVGTLMVTEGKTYPVWLRFPYGGAGGKASMATLPRGYRYLSCVLESPDDREPGTGVNRLSLIFHAYRAFSPSLGTFTLYDYDMSALGPID